MRDDRMNQAHAPSRPLSVLTVAICFGILTGLMEGAGLLVMQSQGWETWQMREASISSRILWVTPLSYGLLFAVLGLLVWCISAILPRLGGIRAAVFFFAWLLFFDLLMMTGRLQRV